jgi:hypothetical protein
MALHKPEHGKWWYWVSWPVLAIGYIILLPAALIRGRHTEPKGNETIRKWNWRWFRKLEDWIDDPVDWLKQKLFNIGELP